MAIKVKQSDMLKENPIIKIYPWFLLCVILLLGIGLRLPNLNRSLWLDEVIYSTSTFMGNSKELLNFIFNDISAPFYRTFMFFWVRLFGELELSVRMPSLICGILSVFLVYLLSSNPKEKLTAILAAFLLCVSPIHIWYSQEAAPYSMTLFLLLMAAFSFYKSREDNPNSRWYLVYFSSLLLAIFSHWCSFTYLFVFSLLCLFKTKRNRNNILMLNFVILLYLVIFFTMKSKFNPFLFSPYLLLRPFTFIDLWTLFFNWFLFGNSLWTISPYGIHLGAILQKPELFSAQVFFLLIFVHGIMVIFREPRNPFGIDAILCLFSLPLFILVLAFTGHKHVYIERYMFIISPFFYMILAKGITGFKNSSVKIILIAIILIFAAATLKGFFTKEEEWTVYKHNPDWKSAANYFLSEQENVGKPISIFVVTGAVPLLYYQRQFGRKKIPYYLDIRLIDYNIGQKTAYEIMQKNESRIFYLIHNSYWTGNFNELLQSTLADSRVRLLSSQTLKGIVIYKFKVLNK